MHCTTVFIAMGGLQVVGAGAIAVQLQASKNATYRCRLNDGEFVDCKQYIDISTYYTYLCILIHCKGVDGQVFQGLTAGTYTLFIEARAIGTDEVAYDTVGPVVLAVGAGASVSEAIGNYMITQRGYFVTSCLSCSCMFWKTTSTLY